MSEQKTTQAGRRGFLKLVTTGYQLQRRCNSGNTGACKF